MTQPPVPLDTMVTFVVRFWRETSAGKLRWRGQIEHVPSHHRAAFHHVGGMLAFLEAYGIGSGGKGATGAQGHRSDVS